MVVKNNKENQLTWAKNIDLFIDIDFLRSVVCCVGPFITMSPHGPVNFGPTQ